MRQVIAKFALHRTALVIIVLAGLISIFGSYVAASSRAAFTRRLMTAGNVPAPSQAAPSQALSVFATANATRPMPRLRSGLAPDLANLDFHAYLAQPAFNMSAVFAQCPAPSLSYANQTVAFNGPVSVSPTSPMNVGSYALHGASTTYPSPGSISVNSLSGLVTISNATPAGMYTIGITATNPANPPTCNPGNTTNVTFMLTVNPPVCTTPTLAYPGPTTVNVNASTTISPSSSSNISSYAIQNNGGFAGGLAINSSTGVVTITNAMAAGGTYTITVRGTNSSNPAGCSPSTTVDAMFTLRVNGPPTFSPEFGITRTAGGSTTPLEPLNVKIIDNLNDDFTPLANLVVTVNNSSSATVAGVTVSNLTRMGNMYFADIAAACNAATGQIPFTLRVTDESGLTKTDILTITVFPDPAPVLTYPQSMPTPLINQGGTYTISPNSGPSDNVSVSSLTVGSAGGFTGNICIRGGTPACAMATPRGQVELSNAAPGGGTFTITINATDNCGVVTPASFMVKVNAPPSVSPVTVTVVQGTTIATNLQIANVNDPEDPATSLGLMLTPVSGSGVTMTLNPATANASGQVKADVTASCMATTSTFNLKATDTNGLSTTSQITVTVAPNTPPTLTYPSPVSVSAGGGTTISPATGPTDSGGITSIVKQSVTPAFPGTITVNNTTGVVTVSGAPITANTYTVVVRATDTCGATKDATFTLNVTAPSIGFSKAAVGASVQPGEAAVFKLTYQNTGNQDATGAFITETVPANTTFNAAASSGIWSCANGSPAGTMCTYTIGGIGALSPSFTIDFAVNVINPVDISVTQISNTATYQDSITPTKSAMASIAVSAFPDMAVTKSDQGVTSMPGGTVVYDLSYSNVGRRNAAGVVLTETVPANSTFNAAASAPSVWSCADGSVAGTTCTIAIGTVNGGVSGMHKFAVDVVPVGSLTPANTTQITNTASISDSSGTDPISSNNSSTDTTPIGNGLILSPMAVGRTQGSPATNSTIATVTDSLAPASSVIVMVTSLPQGISVTNITNITGTINANVAADCSAATGPNMVGLKATDNAGNVAFANLTVNVATNPAPVLGTYPATGPINPGTSASITPSAAPTDNGFIASIVATAAPMFTGTFSVNTATGVINISNAGPSGTYTVTLTATDNCGLTSTAMFQLVVNTPPTITPAATLNLTQGSTTPNGVATVADVNTPAGNLIVTMESVVPPGILLTAFTNIAGAVSATVAVDCNATTGNHNVVLKVTDGGGLTTINTLVVNVLANPAPVQGTYSTSNVTAGAGTIITPSAAPTDNGFIMGIVASAPSFTGGFSVNTATGEITVTNAGPGGPQTVTVTATDNCGLTSTETFTLNVNCPTITVNLPGVTTGAVSAPFNQSFTQTGGVGAVSFSLAAGTLPAGLTLSAAGVLSGTPTVMGMFPITIKATDSNGCMGTSFVYNLDIACQSITVAVPGASNGTVSAAFSQNFSQSGGVGTVTYSLNTGTIPAGLTLNPSTGVLSGTPTQSGSFPLTVKVTDANNCMGVSPTYSLVIACQNIAVTPPAVTTGTVNAVFSQNFTQQGAIGGATFTLNSGSLPTGLTLSAGGTLAGTPTLSGSFPITVKVTDANGCMGISPTYNLVIGCQTIPVTSPVVTTGTVNVAFNQSFTQSAGFGAVNFTLNTGTLPTGLSLAPSGVLSGTPTQTGSFNITVKATDSNGCMGISASYTLVIGCQTITVNPPATTTGTMGAAFNQSFTQTAGFGAVTFTLNSGVLPPGLTLAADGTVSGTPTALGSYPVTVKVTDANGCMGISATTTFVISCQTIMVTPPVVTTGTVGTPFSQSFTQTGGLGAITFALNTGVLPTGITLSSSGLLSGTPTQSGSFPLTVKVTDVNGCMGISATYTLVINCQTITVTPPAVATGTVGVAFSQTFTQTGALGNAANFTLNSGSLPPGLVLALNGQLSGTPTQAGTFPFTVKVTDGNGCTGVSATYTLVISCPTITIAPATLPNGTYGTAYSQTVTALPAGVWNYTVTGGALPNGLSLNATSGLISGTPSFVGTFNFTITAKYYDNCPATMNYTIVINCPVVTLDPPSLLTGTIGLAYSQTVTASPAGTYSYAVSAGALPPGVTVNAATGVISGTPTLVGSFTFTVTATGAGNLAGCPGSKEYTIIINCRTVTVSPTTLPGGKVALAYSQTVSATPAAAYVFTVSQGTLPPGLSLNSSTGVVSGTPTTLGTYNFTITATDPDTCPGSQAYSVVITCPTVALSPATLPTGTIGGPYPVTTFSATPAGTYTFAVTSGNLPAGLTLSSAGVLSGTSTQSGSFPITVTATDANQCTGSHNYTLVINSCPTITVDPPTVATGTVGQAYNLTFIATGGSGPYIFTKTGQPLPNGMSLSSAGVLSGTPTQSGVYSFTVVATDANHCMGSRPYTLTIKQAAGNGSGLQYFPLAYPVRLLDTRPGQVGCDAPGVPIAGGTSHTLVARRTCNGLLIPANARAITGNVTTVQSGGGYLTLYPSDAAQPTVANTNFGPNEIINNVFTVGLGDVDGAFKIFATSTTHVVVDVTGYYAPPEAGGLYYHPLPKPIRLLETRAGETGCFAPGTPLLGGVDTAQQARLTCSGVTIPAAARSIVGNATTVGPVSNGFLTLYPAGVARPFVASSNFLAGQIMNAPFTVGLSATGTFNIFTTSNTHLVIDVVGYYSPDATDINGLGLLFNVLSRPVRLLETRAGFNGCNTPAAPIVGGVGQLQPARGFCEGLEIAANAQALVGNATVVSPSNGGYLTLWPSTAAQPAVAASNFLAGQVFNRHFTVGLGVADGAFWIFSSATTNLVIDVSGYFAP